MIKTEKVQTPLGEVYYEDGILFTEFEVQNPSMEDAEKHLEMVKENFGQYDLSLSVFL